MSECNRSEVIDQKKLGKKDAAHHLASSTIKSVLAKIDRSTPEDLRDYVLLSTALTTGRRASEIAGLRYKHLHRDVYLPGKYLSAAAALTAR